AQCGACHTPVAWNPAVNCDHTQARGSCSTCHNGTMAQGKGPTHIVTDLECDACHTTLSWAGAMFTHVGVTSGCATCHDGVHADGLAANHFPIGSGCAAVPCEACHSTTEFTTWAVATMSHPAAVALSRASCHETANFVGMHPSTDTAAGDSRPSAKLDSLHPTTGDCSQCHDTTTFSQSASRPANHIPTSAPCPQCHTTAGNYALYSVTATHQGVTGCLSCRGREQLRHLPRERPVPRDDGEQHDRLGRLPPAGLRQAAPRRRRLQRLPHHDTDLRDGPDAVRQAGQSHSNHRAVHAVPHHRGQLRGLLGHGDPPGRDAVPVLPRPDGGDVLRQHHPPHQPVQPHSVR